MALTLVASWTITSVYFITKQSAVIYIPLGKMVFYYLQSHKSQYRRLAAAMNDLCHASYWCSDNVNHKPLSDRNKSHVYEFLVDWFVCSCLCSNVSDIAD
ncbi:LOW QUALITY PROTEIN: hypothetical protein MAR_008002 [Mya arenaria]|uniref:Uncharacterized protein n=1 Tax=Mya arenaria TaxID=6604 RepID=A0ABY7DZ60_MYAAR|nr:LOW QUALITY PROTEIN: hypothetical protein MAR_008002 [Mya arenaria]